MEDDINGEMQIFPVVHVVLVAFGASGMGFMTFYK